MSHHTQYTPRYATVGNSSESMLDCDVVCLQKPYRIKGKRLREVCWELLSDLLSCVAIVVPLYPKRTVAGTVLKLVHLTMWKGHLKPSFGRITCLHLAQTIFTNYTQPRRALSSFSEPCLNGTDYVKQSRHLCGCFHSFTAVPSDEVSQIPGKML